MILPDTIPKRSGFHAGIVCDVRSDCLGGVETIRFGKEFAGCFDISDERRLVIFLTAPICEHDKY